MKLTTIVGLIIGAIGILGMPMSFIGMADKARREGLLALEEDAHSVVDSFAGNALMLMIDGTAPEALQSIMERRSAGSLETGRAVAGPEG